MGHADYRKHNDRSHNSSTYHKKDGTPVRNKLNQEAKEEISEYTEGNPHEYRTKNFTGKENKND